MSSQILVVAELHDGHVRKSPHSAITFARNTKLPFSILVVGANAKAAAAEVTGYGAAKVIAAEDAKLANPVCELVAPTVAQVAKNGGFDVIAMTARSFGKDVAPFGLARESHVYWWDQHNDHPLNVRLRHLGDTIHRGEVVGWIEIHSVEKPVPLVALRSAAAPTLWHRIL